MHICKDEVLHYYSAGQRPIIGFSWQPNLSNIPQYCNIPPNGCSQLVLISSRNATLRSERFPVKLNPSAAFNGHDRVPQAPPLYLLGKFLSRRDNILLLRTIMSNFRNPSADPGFSTLEVDHRGPHSTLEVKPGEGIEPSNSVPTTQKQSEGPSPPVVTKPWWKRYWLAIVVISILMTGSIIGGAVGGTLAPQKESNETSNSEEAATTSR